MPLLHLFLFLFFPKTRERKRGTPHLENVFSKHFKNTTTRRERFSLSLSLSHTQRERFKERDSKRERNSKKKRKRGAAAVCCDHHRSHRRDVPSFLLSLIRVSSFGVFFGFSKVFFLSFLHILLLKHARIKTRFTSQKREKRRIKKERETLAFFERRKNREQRGGERREEYAFFVRFRCAIISTHAHGRRKRRRKKKDKIFLFV